VGAIDAQFVGEMQGRNALGDATQNLDNRGTAIAGLPEDRAGEQIKDCTTLPTAVIGNNRSSPSVRRLIGAKWMAVRTVQAIWMQTVISLFHVESLWGGDGR
jgi:hypothetical protein